MGRTNHSEWMIPTKAGLGWRLWQIAFPPSPGQTRHLGSVLISDMHAFFFWREPARERA